MELSFDQLEEAITTTRVVFSDSYSDGSSYCERASPTFQFAFLDGGRTSPSREQRVAMNDRDKSIYNSLGSSSSSRGKLTYTELGLYRDTQKRGIMAKTGPCPSWYSLWRERVFILKDNFLYYFSAHDVHKLNDAPVLGAIYLKNAMIEKVSMPFAKHVLKITPLVPRRRGWDEDDETGVFHIKFKTKEGREEWYEELQQVAFSHQFHAMKEPLITKSMVFTHELQDSRKPQTHH